MPAARGQLPQKKLSGNLDDVLGVALRRWRGWRGSGSSMSWAGSRWPSASTGNSGPHLMAEAGADEAAKRQRVAMTADSPKGTGGCAALHHRLHYGLCHTRTAQGNEVVERTKDASKERSSPGQVDCTHKSKRRRQHAFLDACPNWIEISFFL
jgi:hypothetical protein